MTFKPHIISEFRQHLTKNETYLLKIFGAVEGEKNHWKLINSCLDWMTVATNYIDGNWNICGNHDEKSMHLYSLISAADLIFESIQQLNRIVNGRKSKCPFANESTIFENKIYPNLDDNKYFKELRSIFGAHPVNLKKMEKMKIQMTAKCTHLGLTK